MTMQHISKPFPPCERCKISGVATARGDWEGYICQQCLEKWLGSLKAFRRGQKSLLGSLGNFSRRGLAKHGEPSPSQEHALRTWEEGE